jgi:hypothetical protein
MKLSRAKRLGPRILSRNGYGFACRTVLYLINCIPIICKNGSGSALEFQNPNINCILYNCKKRSGSALELQNPIPRNCKSGSESFRELHYWVGICLFFCTPNYDLSVTNIFTMVNAVWLEHIRHTAKYLMKSMYMNCKHGLGSASDFVVHNGICLRRRFSME